MNINFNKKCVWDVLNNSSIPIVLYGMGNGADKVLNEFKKRNINAYGVMASDDFARYQNYRGYIVKKLTDFEKELDEFIIALCFGSDLQNVIDHIYEINKKHHVLVPNVSLFGDEIVDNTFLEINKEKIESAYSLLYDEKSKEVFKKSLYFLYTGEIEVLKEIESSKNDALTLLELNDSERYLDLGAYNGDTIYEFLSQVSNYKEIIAVEPNPKNFQKLLTNINNLSNTYALNVAISDSIGTSFISKNSGRMACLSESGDIKINTTSIDELNKEHNFTYIKADIEGLESKMLTGAKKALQSKPKLRISAYHKPSDMWNLILQINKINKNYKFYLRKHQYIPLWDLNIYAI